MKQIFFSFCIVLICCIITLPSVAKAKTLYPVQSELSIDDVACRTYRATIDGYNEQEHSLTISIYDVESFPVTDVALLIPGDSIVITEKWTQAKKEILIQTIVYSENDLICNINGQLSDTEIPIKLRLSNYGNLYQPEKYGIPIWTRIGTRSFNLSDQFLFLDGTTKTTHDPQDIPTVYTQEEFFLLLEYPNEKEDVGFALYNIYVVFNEKEELLILYRFFVDWQ